MLLYLKQDVGDLIVDNGTIEGNLTYGLNHEYTQEELNHTSIMSNSKVFIN